MKCGECRFFTPCIPHPWMGYCPVLDKVSVNEAEGCSLFRGFSLNELSDILDSIGHLYCATCRTTITSREELEEHYRKGHVLTPHFIVYDGLYLETYVAD